MATGYNCQEVNKFWTRILRKKLIKREVNADTMVEQIYIRIKDTY